MNLSIVEDSHSLFLNHKFQNVSKNGKMLDFDDTYIPEEIDELGLLKNKIINYLNNGEYERDIEKVVKLAMKHIVTTYKEVNNPAVVLDIDETALSNAQLHLENNFNVTYEKLIEWRYSQKAVAIKPVLELYKICKSMGIKVFFVTGRKKVDKDITISNLKKEGFDNFDGIFFRDPELSVGESKVKARKEIVGMGYTIIANIGDQLSDLLGGYSLKGFKLPNPLYYVSFNKK